MLLPHHIATLRFLAATPSKAGNRRGDGLPKARTLGHLRAMGYAQRAADGTWSITRDGLALLTAVDLAERTKRPTL